MRSNFEENSQIKVTNTVYLIEDNLKMQQSIENMLGFLGYKVISFSNGGDFLAAQLQDAPAVVVTDMRMPDISGVELQAELIKRGRNLPIIFISGESTLAQGILAMQQGAIEFLTKPFEREEFLAAIVRGLELDAKNVRSFLQKQSFEQQLQSLAPREREAFELLALGYSNAQIQEALQISLSTAKQYKSEVMRKLNLRSLAQLISLKKQVFDTK
jgi:FixJ family two-component response regulator